MEPQPLAWWVWIVMGLVLATGEILTPGGFYIVFFGAGAIVAGLLKLAIPGTPLAIQGLTFVAVSVASLLLFRKPLLERFKVLSPVSRADDFVGETAVAMEEIGANGFGKAEMRGTSWNVQNLSPAPIPKGRRCRVERVEGLTLFVQAQ